MKKGFLFLIVAVLSIGLSIGVGAAREYNLDLGKKVVLQVGSCEASINNDKVTLDASPFIQNGRTLVPLRFIAEALNAEVGWDPTNKIVTVIRVKDSWGFSGKNNLAIPESPNKKILLQINNDVVIVTNSDFGFSDGGPNPEKLTLGLNNSKVIDSAPLIVNGRTMVPLRFIAEELGVEVGWEPTTKTITLYESYSSSSSN